MKSWPKTVYCSNAGCDAHKRQVPFTTLVFRKSRNCEVCGLPMADGERFSGLIKSGRKIVIGKATRRFKIVGAKTVSRKQASTKKSPSKKKSHKR
jgi:hypothetical protein